MILKKIKPNKLNIVAVLCIGFCVASCTSNTNNNEALNKIDNANSLYCLPGSENVRLNLTNIELTREQDIPLMYQGFNNIEGPVWYDGALYYSNMGSHQPDENGFELSNQSTIWRWVPGNKPQVWMKDTKAGTNGLAIDSKGKLIVTRQLDGSLSYINWQTKQVTPIASTFQSKRFNSPNDLTIGHDDTVYFTDPNWNTPSNINLADIQGGGKPGSIEPGQRIYRVTANGAVTATKVTELVPALRDKPNGIILSLNQLQLIVGGLQGLWSFDLDSGKVSNPRKWLSTQIDGLGKDCSGNIYVTTTREMPERKDGQVVVILDKQFREIGVLNLPDIHNVTNIAFGGNDGKTLFVTGLTAPMDGNNLRQCGRAPCSKASIYTTKLNVQGFPF
ncbi:SMP-30/gluconolactonase/LRE family protein [Paraglaciecola sp. 20A4]|uniref:SMP-30/gluconolactonase/LRE family protein n=1 Tax=Paraglaciecola sp. 20A4 TaxID=2687288 RepID=UPI00140B7433|nr:SMP-30/gluconolactonase/LRE family protein [Paraglaciecola sp. 20A4]